MSKQEQMLKQNKRIMQQAKSADVSLIVPDKQPFDDDNFKDYYRSDYLG